MPLEDLSLATLIYHPNLRSGQNYIVTSARTDIYNCIGWAMGDTERWWWPSSEPDEAFWPEEVPREPTLAAFTSAFGTVGYTVCENADVEPGYEKVAVFADAEGIPTHTARQLDSGHWTSKLGALQDIEHSTLADLSDRTYGTVQVLLRRRRIPSDETKE